jgi:hypothetical protein
MYATRTIFIDVGRTPGVQPANQIGEPTMNQHLPLSNIRELTVNPVTEQFILVRGKYSAWIDGDLMSRSEVIKEVDGDAYEDLRCIIALSDLASETGTWRKATDEITSIVIQRWAEDGKLLTEKQKEFVAMCKGEAFANCFRLEVA